MYLFMINEFITLFLLSLEYWGWLLGISQVLIVVGSVGQLMYRYCFNNFPNDDKTIYFEDLFLQFFKQETIVISCCVLSSYSFDVLYSSSMFRSWQFLNTQRKQCQMEVSSLYKAYKVVALGRGWIFELCFELSGKKVICELPVKRVRQDVSRMWSFQYRFYQPITMTTRKANSY